MKVVQYLCIVVVFYELVALYKNTNMFHDVQTKTPENLKLFDVFSYKIMWLILSVKCENSFIKLLYFLNISDLV